MACNIPNGGVMDGVCRALPAGQQDNSPTGACTGSATCHGSNNCTGKLNGDACEKASECVSGSCVDGHCCNVACKGMCTACDVPGSVGTCVPVPQGQQDAAAGCGGTGTCDGAGSCVARVDGDACAQASECASGFCADGHCCNTLCDGPCTSCDIPGLEGVCANLPAGQPDNAPLNSCTGTSTCDGNGSCVAGQPCAQASDCASGFCADGYCCDSACGGTCAACDVPGHVGVCSFVPVGAQDPACLANACDGAGHCRVGIGSACNSASQCVTNACNHGICCFDAICPMCEACNAATGLCDAMLMNGKPDPDSNPPCELCTVLDPTPGHAHVPMCWASGGGAPCFSNLDCWGGSICYHGVCQ